MGTHLFICIRNKVLTNNIEFFNSDEWNAETENQLLHELHDMISAIRPEGTKLTIDVNIEVENFTLVNNAVNKRLRKEQVINHQKLSIREMEVLGLIMQGLTNKKISEKLFISFETVRSHRKNILEKTGAPNTAALINHYHQTFFDK